MRNVEKKSVRFSYPKRKGLNEVHLGSEAFGWDWRAVPFEISPNGEFFELNVELPIGEWQYRLVLNQKRWIADPNAPSIRDMNSNKNSLVIVYPSGFDKVPVGQIHEEFVSFDFNENCFRSGENGLVLNISTRKGDVADVTGNAQVGEWTARGHFEKVSSNALYDHWRCWFELNDFNQMVKISFLFNPEDIASPILNREYVFSVKDMPRMIVPEGTAGEIIYQIFPDRFATSEAKDGSIVHKKNLREFWGGNLSGIGGKFNHLVKLKIQSIYLNPIFECASYHGYDTINFEKIEPRFGTMSDLKSLIQTGHSKGIKIILDGVFNHTSTQHENFVSVTKLGKVSPHAHWYTIIQEPVKMEQGQQTYVCWAGVYAMPKVDLEAEEPVNYFLGLCEQYLDMGIGGWRFDVANEVPISFWQKVNQMVNSRKEVTSMVGEHWNDATQWLKGDQWNSVMNYPWRALVLGWLNGQITTRAFQKGIKELQERYPEECLNQLWNLLGSHDTPRVATLLGNDQGKLECAFALQMTLPGAPMIYAGDEFGMLGGHDPECRYAIDWSGKNWNKPLLNWIIKLTELRSNTQTFKSGKTREIFNKLGKNVYSFERYDAQQAYVVYINRSAKQVKFEAKEGWELVLSNFELTKWLAPYGVLIYLRRS